MTAEILPAHAEDYLRRRALKEWTLEKNGRRLHIDPGDSLISVSVYALEPDQRDGLRKGNMAFLSPTEAIDLGTFLVLAGERELERNRDARARRKARK